MRKYLWKNGYHKHSFVRDIIDYSLASKADMVIIPMGDWLHLGNEARLNLPGTVGAPNWTWCMNDFSKFAEEVPSIRQALEYSRRTARKL
jgi:4-alpha-glucanotransferase